LDELTGLFNRRYLDAFLAAAFRHAKETGRPLSVAFADLDRFKHVNDQHGHQAGDHVLSATARLLQCSVRSSDIVARYGGEEFVLAFPDTDRRTAHAICERVVQACRRARHKLEADAASRSRSPSARQRSTRRATSRPATTSSRPRTRRSTRRSSAGATAR